MAESVAGFIGRFQEFLKSNREVFLLAFLACIVTAPFWSAHLQYLFDESIFNEEKRQIFYSYLWNDPELFPNDIFIDFYRSQDLPLLYKLVLFICAKLGAFSFFFKVLPALALAATVFFVTSSARILGGVAAALPAAAVTLGFNIYYTQIFSGVSHAYAFPLLTCLLWSLLTRNIYVLIALCVLSAGIYHVIAPIVGLCLAWVLILGPVEFRGRAAEWNYKKRFSVLIVTGLCSVALLYFSMVPPPAEFGPSLKPFTQTDLYPENSAEGRYFAGAWEPVPFLFYRYFLNFDIGASIKNTAPGVNQELFFWGMFLISASLLPLFRLFKKSDLIRALLPFLTISALISAFFLLFLPSFSYRFPLYTFFSIFPVFLGVAVSQILSQFEIERKYVLFFPFLISAVICLTLAPANAYNSTNFAGVGPNETRLYQFISQTPKDALIAGFPGFGQVTELVPVQSKRSILVLHKAHYPAYETYTLTLRGRMNALLDAYFGQDWANIRKLRDDYGVDYLLVDLRHYKEKPRYFLPFGYKIEDLWLRGIQEGFLLADIPDRGVVYQDADFYILDLSKI